MDPHDALYWCDQVWTPMCPPPWNAACMVFGLGVSVTRPRHAEDHTHLPRMFPPIMKCVVLSDSWFCAKNE
jgi:hypothetical protein